MIVSGFLVTSIINSIVGEQKRQIGVMKSLGASLWNNFVIYVGVAMAYGVIGTVPGVATGAYLGSLMATSLGGLAAPSSKGSPCRPAVSL